MMPEYDVSDNDSGVTRFPSEIRAARSMTFWSTFWAAAAGSALTIVLLILVAAALNL